MQIPTNYLKGLVLAILFSFPSLAFPQVSDWTWQNPKPQGNDLYQVNMIDQNLIYAIGNGGTVMKSADGGVTWAILNTGTTRNLRQADFLQNGLTAYAVGYAQGAGSCLIKTTDGGINWQNVNINQNYYLYSIDFIDEQTGFVGGRIGLENHFIFKTTDGGLNWSQSVPLDEGIIAIRFPFNNLTGFASGHNNNTGTNSIYKTIDGGSNWVKKTIPVLSMFSDIKSFCFVSDQIGYAAGAGTILKTTDSGETWVSVYTGNNSYKSICFPENETTGYVVGDFNTALKTTDGGSSWQTLNTNVSGTHFYNSVSFINNQSGFIVGSNGIIVKTTDGGQNWLNLRPAIAVGWLQSIDFPVNSQTGYIAGLGGLILKTSNGGNLWTQQNTNTGRILNKIQFLDNDNGYAVGGFGTILKTADGGQNWISLASGFSQDLFDVEFPVTPLTGYVSGLSGKLAKTTDGGNTWVPIGTFNKDIMAMCFPTDNLTGYLATGDQKIYKTTDGGINWAVKYDGNKPNTGIADILFPFDTETGYALSDANGNKILKTTDGGNTWTIKDAGTSSRLYSLSFPAKEVGYIAADGMYGNNPLAFLKTTDGGLNWNSVSVPYSYSLMSVCFPHGVDTGYVIGNQSGAILKTTTGGGIFTSVSDSPAGNQFTDKTFVRNYPNPFTESTTIAWQLPKDAHVVLKVFDFTGREIKTLMDCEQAKGEHKVKFDVTSLPAGVYFYQLRVNGISEIKKMIYLK